MRTLVVCLAALLTTMFAAPLAARAQSANAASADEPEAETCVEARVYLLAFREETGRPRVGADSAPIWRGCFETRRSRPPRSRRAARVNGR